MTPPPQPGGDPGQYEESIAQWLLERTFFIDFLYRNPKERGGRGELGDAVVLYDDIALMVQIKGQFSIRDPLSWARKNIGKAAKQLSHTHRMLFDGHITELENPLFGKVPFDRNRYLTRIGLIVIASDGEPFVAEREIPDLQNLPFPVHVLSLRDLVMLLDRFDTAGDFVPYLELRWDMRATIDRAVHAEIASLRRVAQQLDSFLNATQPAISRELLERTVRYFRLTADGLLQKSPDYRYGLLIDDIIAHIHDHDSSLAWNSIEIDSRRLGQISAPFAWLNRVRRIGLGKKVLALYEAAQNGEMQYFAHYRRAGDVAIVFLATDEPRKDRVDSLRYLVDAAQVAYMAKAVVGVATEPLGKGGRSYDLFMQLGGVDPQSRDFFEKHGSPFSAGEEQLLP